MFREIEAIKGYDSVRQELASAHIEIKELQTKVIDYEEIKKDRDATRARLAGLNDKVVKAITHVLAEMEKPKDQRRYDQQLIDSNLATMIEKTVGDFVARRTSEAVEDLPIKNFRDEVQRQIDELLLSWHPRLGARLPAREKILKQKICDNPYAVLTRRWNFKCTKCKFTHDLELQSTTDVKELLIKQHVDVPLSSLAAGVIGEHSVTVTLADVVQAYLTRTTLRES